MKLKIFIFILVIFIINGCIHPTNAPVIVIHPTTHPSEPQVTVQPSINNTKSDIPLSTPVLRDYKSENTLNGFYQPTEPKSYIIPKNEWVKYYASQLFINKDGVLQYKIKEPFPVVSYTSFMNNYIKDEEQFKVDDYWINPDYYLTHNMTGDCEDFALTVTSMMLSGEISILQDDTFIKQKIPAKAMMGYYEGKRHTWVEYEIYGNTYIAHSEGNYYVLDIKQGSITDYVKKSDVKDNFKPLFEFTDEYFGGYYEN